MPGLLNENECKAVLKNPVMAAGPETQNPQYEKLFLKRRAKFLQHGAT